MKRTTIHLTRVQYDRLLENAGFPLKAYLECKRNWSIDGVTVTGSEKKINLIKESI